MLRAFVPLNWRLPFHVCALLLVRVRAPPLVLSNWPPVMNPNTAVNSACAVDGGTFCDGGGQCVQCNTPAHCGTNTFCQTYTCNAGTCGTSPTTVIHQSPWRRISVCVAPTAVRMARWWRCGSKGSMNTDT